MTYTHAELDALINATDRVLLHHPFAVGTAEFAAAAADLLPHVLAATEELRARMAASATTDVRDHILQLVKLGHKQFEIAAAAGVSTATISRIVTDSYGTAGALVADRIMNIPLEAAPPRPIDQELVRKVLAGEPVVIPKGQRINYARHLTHPSYGLTTLEIAQLLNMRHTQMVAALQKGVA